MDIRIKELSKSYGELHVFNRFSCRFPEGKTTCVMGESGIGKTTLIHLLLGLEKPDAGEIAGVPHGKMAALREPKCGGERAPDWEKKTG